MAIDYGFFDSVNNDRVYNADQMSNMFKGLISDGIFENVSNRFIVTSVSGQLKVYVGTGRAFVKDKWIENSSPVTVSLNSPHPILNRYTAIVLRKDVANRSVIITTIDGTNATNPSYPSIVRDDNYYDLCLAYVYVKANATEILQDDIIDTRTNSDICGWVTGIIRQVDTSDLFLQYLAAYQTMMNTMQSWYSQEQQSYISWFDSLTQSLVVELDVTRSRAVLRTNSDIDSVTYNISAASSNVDFVYSTGGFDYITSTNVKSMTNIYINGLLVDPHRYRISYSNGVITINFTNVASDYSGLDEPIGTLDPDTTIVVEYISRKVAQ
jgi:hypothetical protein